MQTLVLIPGFLGPNGKSLREQYWGTISAAAKGRFRTIFPKVGPVGSAHDRACEIFAFLVGTRVDYGEIHSKNCKHIQFGDDFSGEGAFPSWSEKNPVNLIGHSFGGNTARMLVYLLSIDFFGVGSTTKWVKSIITISSPLQGTLLTYALGASEDESAECPVKMFSVGYNLGIGGHFITMLSTIGINVDVGFEKFGITKLGWTGFCRAFIGGRNGGGSPCVCDKDNAGHDMTIPRAKMQNEAFKENVDASSLFEFHFVASKHVDGNYNVVKSYRKHFGNQSASSIYSGLLCARDFVTSFLATRTSKRARHQILREVVFNENHNDLEGHLGKTDGVCSTYSQFVARHNENEATEQFILSFNHEKFREIDFIPGTYRIDLSDHTHLSLVPFPDDFNKQKDFYDTLFHVLEKL